MQKVLFLSALLTGYRNYRLKSRLSVYECRRRRQLEKVLVYDALETFTGNMSILSYFHFLRLLWHRNTILTKLGKFGRLSKDPYL